MWNAQSGYSLLLIAKYKINETKEEVESKKELEFEDLNKLLACPFCQRMIKCSGENTKDMARQTLPG